MTFQMTLQIALSLLFSGSVLLIVALRWFERERYGAYETFITSCESQLAVLCPSAPNLVLRFLGDFQSLAFLGLAVRNTMLVENNQELRRSVQSQLQFCFEKTLKAAQSQTPQALLEARNGLQLLREQYLADLLKLSLFQQSEAYLPSAVQTEEITEFIAPAELSTFVEVETQPDWDLEDGRDIEQACRRLQHLHWSFSQAQLGSEFVLFQERVSLLLQSWGPLWTTFCQLLTPEQHEQARQSLQQQSTAQAQALFNLRIYWRLAQQSKAEDFEAWQTLVLQIQSQLTEQLTAGLGQLHRLLYAPQTVLNNGLPAKALAELKNLSRAAEKLADFVLSEAERRISYDWFIIEAIYGHPRGLKLVAEKHLKCFGCLALSSENLAAAEIVHGFEQGAFLQFLQNASNSPADEVAVA